MKRRIGMFLDLGEWRVHLANHRRRRGRVGEAERAYRKILGARPDQYAALAGLGRLLLDTRRFDEAVEVWQRAADLHPHRAEGLFQLARALHRSRQFEAAAAKYLHVLTLDPSYAKAAEALEQLNHRLARTGRNGTAAVQATAVLAQQMLASESGSARTRDTANTLLAAVRAKDDPDAAVEFWQQLATRDPGSIEPPLQIARIRKRQGRNEAALNFFRTVLSLDSLHAEALVGYGQALETKDQAGALRHFHDWARQRPQDPVPLLEAARLYQKQENWAQAETTYRELLTRIPDSQTALSRLAQILSRDPNRVNQALDVWLRIAERDRTTVYALLQCAYLLERAWRPGEAEAKYRAALQSAPNDEMALAGLSRLLTGQARWEDALPLFETLHAANPGRTDALVGLARCLERLDRGEDALLAYEKVLALDSGNSSALVSRGRLLRQLGRVSEAIDMWQRICRQTPGNSTAWYELIFMLASAERDDEALAALNSAEAALPAMAASWARLGQAAQAGQFHDRAVAYFERAIAAEPDDAGFRARLGEHYARRGIVDGAFHHLLASRELRPGDVAVARQLVEVVHTLDVLGIDSVALDTPPRSTGMVLVPEKLFERVREIADTGIVPYVPVAGRIVVVSSSLAGGGAERQVVNLLRGLSVPALDLDIGLFCVSLARNSRRDFFLPLLADARVEVVTPDESRLGAYLANPDVAPFAALIRAFPADMIVPIAFWLGEFRRRRPQIVHAWQDSTNLTAAVAALLAGVPRIVLGARSLRPDNPRRRLKRHMRDAYRAILGHPAVILTSNSRAGAADYADWLGIDARAIAVVHNGIDFDSLAARVDARRSRGLRDAIGVPAAAPLVGSAFRMSEEKRPLLWVEAAAEVHRRAPEAHFVVYGDGPMRADMLARARELGIADRLHLPGPVDEIGSCYTAMDVVMLTSRHEGLPNVLLEAQSLGVPVVAPDVGGVAEAMWPGVTGWAVADADGPALAEHVVKCLRDSAWTATARARGPIFVREQFGIPAMLARTLEIYGMARTGGPI